MNDDIETFAKATLQHIIALQSRVDSLTAMVTLLARNQGAEPEAVRQALRTVETAAKQKRLEAMELTNPAVAAQLTDDSELSEESLNLMRHLKLDRSENED
jgi:phage repressor protein C with HTH and peptisase S24 domain